VTERVHRVGFVRRRMDQGWMKEFTGRKKMKGEKRRDERSFSLSLPYFSKPALFNGIGVYLNITI
jgi:hypothetical protein